MYFIPSKYLIICTVFMLLFSHIPYLRKASRFVSVKDLQESVLHALKESFKRGLRYFQQRLILWNLL